MRSYTADLWRTAQYREPILWAKLADGSMCEDEVELNINASLERAEAYINVCRRYYSGDKSLWLAVNGRYNEPPVETLI